MGHWGDVFSFLVVGKKGTGTTCLFCSLWIYFTLCFGVSVVDFEQVKARWVALFGNRYQIRKLLFAGVHILVELRTFGILLCWGMISFKAFILLF